MERPRVGVRPTAPAKSPGHQPASAVTREQGRHQPLPAPASKSPQPRPCHYGAETSPLHCALPKFLPHRSPEKCLFYATKLWGNFICHQGSWSRDENRRGPAWSVLKAAYELFWVSGFDSLHREVEICPEGSSGRS